MENYNNRLKRIRKRHAKWETEKRDCDKLEGELEKELSEANANLDAAVSVRTTSARPPNGGP